MGKELTKEEKGILKAFPEDGSLVSIEQIAERLPLSKQERAKFIRGVKEMERKKKTDAEIRKITEFPRTQRFQA